MVGLCLVEDWVSKHGGPLLWMDGGWVSKHGGPLLVVEVEHGGLLHG